MSVSDVADLAPGAQQLALDVHPVLGQDAVDRGQHARHVAVHVDQPVRAAAAAAGRRGGRLTLSVVAPSATNSRELVGHERADVGLRLLGRAADVRGEDDVGQPAQLGDELVAAALGLDREHVDRGAGDVARLEVLAQRGVVDDEAAARG